MSDSPATFDLRQAVRLAGVAAAAYLDDPEAISRALGADELREFTANGVSGFTALVGKEVLVAFRGTQARHMRNWVTNLDYEQIAGATGRVHRGFATALDDMWEQVARQVRHFRTPPMAVWVTGHSLGGALATLAALRLAAKHPVAGVYAFGAPRVGCPEFAAKYPLPFHRVEAAADLVCCLPLLPEQFQGMEPLLKVLGRVLPQRMLPRDVAYHHAGYLTVLEADGKVRSARERGEDPHQPAVRLACILQQLMSRGLPTLLEQHSIHAYHSALRNAQKLMEATDPATRRPTGMTCEGFAMTELERLHARCSAWVDDLSRVAAVLSEPEVSQQARERLQEALGDPTIRVCVCGEWNAGKSSLLNALLGIPNLLPTDVRPTTSYITVVRPGDTATVKVIRDDGEERITPGELKTRFQATESDPTVERIEVTAPGRFPERETAFVDTPGLEDLSKTRARVTLEYLPRADVILLVLDAGPGVKSTTRRFLRENMTDRERGCVLAVVNRVDALPRAADVAAKVEHVGESLQDLLPGVPVLPTTAALALEALEAMEPIPQRSGIPALTAAIKALVGKRRGEFLASRFSRGARILLELLQTRLAAEEQALGSTVEQAQAQEAAFQQREAYILRQSGVTFDLAEKQIIEGLRPWLQSLPARLGQQVQQMRAEVAAIETLDGLRRYIQREDLQREVARLQLQLNQEAVELFRQVTARVVQDTLRPSLEAVIAAGGVSSRSVPAIDHLILRLPDIVIEAFDFLIVVVLPWLQGTHPVLKVLLILLKSLVEGQLRAAIEDQLRGLPQLFSGSYVDAFRELQGKVLDELRNTLQGQLAAAEAGLRDARARLEHEGQTVAGRKRELQAAGLELDRLRQGLTTLSSAADGAAGSSF
jgi:hypothetical protein